MKANQFFFLSILVLFSARSMAQTTAKKFTWGLKVGANFSQLDDLSYQTPRLGSDGLPVMSGGNVVYDFFQQNDAHTTGLVGGAYARIGRKMYIQPEVLFSVKGGKMDLIRQGLETRSFDTRVGSIDLPLLLGIKLGPLRLNAGPMASLRVLDGDLKGALKEYTSQSVRQSIQQAQFGYQAGIGLSFSGMQLDLRREGGLGKSASTTAEPTTPASVSPRSSLWQLTVGFGF
ncbi:outer membrane beta-barrel protein [Salmonirosea aquatica]|uniref:Outer membrane beta-barrel protein n=1 Tax=Salmonirosea aquatica TaxID=2654236 RepID=A0A7C9FBK2_9BACT|nr:outer membrane beta-barrel protein [Cytophagaceae bacterium SJW1-29]